MPQHALIGFAEALAAPEVVWSLASQGYAITAFGRRGRTTPLRRSRFVRVVEIAPPEVDSRQTLADISALAAQLSKTSQGPLVVMPLDDETVWLCGQAELGDHTVLAGPRGAGVDLALDKCRQIELARAAGFAVPWTRVVRKREEALAETLRFPVVFKPSDAVRNADNRLGKGRSWICADAAELEAALKQWNGAMPMLLQEFIPGTGEGFFGLATARGVVGWSRHRRVRMMNPHGSGASACAAILEPDKNSEAAGERFVQQGGWRGLFMIELLRDRAGKLWFMEFNGRTWGSMALARRSGLEYPAWAAQLALNPETTFAIPPRTGEGLVCRHLGRELMHLVFVLKGSKSKAITEWPSFWKTLPEMLQCKRNHRWYNWSREDRGVFFSDVASTLKNQLFRSRSPH